MPIRIPISDSFFYTGVVRYNIGIHFPSFKRLLVVCHRLSQRGATVIRLQLGLVIFRNHVLVHLYFNRVQVHSSWALLVLLKVGILMGVSSARTEYFFPIFFDSSSGVDIAHALRRHHSVVE